MKPYISVVVPAKNEEKVIEKCLKALKNQTMHCEIIVVDGHSTDNTLKIAKRYADKIILDNKKGISDARNIGAKIASGEIVAYCDADAIPRKRWVETIAKNIKNSIGLYGPIIPYNGNKKTRISIRFLNKIVQLLHKLGHPCICGANMAFKRSAIIKHRFNVKMSILEDYEMGNRLKKYGKICYYTKLAMPISSRRYEGSIFYTVFFHYLRNVYRLERGKRIDPANYWSQLDK